MRLAFAFWMAACGVAISSALAAEPAADSEPLQIARTFAQQYAQAFDAGDVAKLGEFWTADAQFVDVGGHHIEGRENIVKAFQQAFTEQPGAKLKLEVLAAKMVSDGVILADIVPKVVPPPAGSPAETAASLLLVKEDDRWLIASVRDTMRRAANAEHLKPLEWLLGSWSSKPAEGAPVRSWHNVRWTDTQSFLVREFTISQNDSRLHGMEVVAWDPKQKKIRSWSFDSNGSFFESTWTPEGAGKQWTIETTGVLPDGQEIREIETLVRVDGDTVRYAPGRMTIGGEEQPARGPIDLVRSKTDATDADAKPVLPAVQRP
ncbi:MAG: YybH family protein [Planctomycetota bacterium]